MELLSLHFFQARLFYYPNTRREGPPVRFEEQRAGGFARKPCQPPLSANTTAT